MDARASRTLFARTLLAMTRASGILSDMPRPHTFKHGLVDVTFIMDERKRCGTAKIGAIEIALQPGRLALDQVAEEFHDALRELHDQIFSDGSASGPIS